MQNSKKYYCAIGLMSGTSMDGCDAALLYTDGIRIDRFGAAIANGYSLEFREKLRNTLDHVKKFEQRQPDDTTVMAVERELTDRHARVVSDLLRQADLTAADVDVIGFHGQTILHRPDMGFTWQIGDGAYLAKLTGIGVVNDFRANDMAYGGQGAPFAPLYHQALMKNRHSDGGPVAVLNLGGVGNVTWIAADGAQILSFDTGPANALIDDWMQKMTGQPFDMNGECARLGKVDSDQLTRLMEHDYFTRPTPKSLDRGDFTISGLSDLSAEDGAATLTAFTVQSVKAALSCLPELPIAWYVTGGGRYNLALMEGLAESLSVPVEPVEALGWRGDALEAEAFAYLAVRSLLGLPLSLPTTTGVKKAVTGGAFYPSLLSR